MSWHFSIANLPLADYATTLKECVTKHFEEHPPHPYIAEKQQAQIDAALAEVDVVVSKLLPTDQAKQQMAVAEDTVKRITESNAAARAKNPRAAQQPIPRPPTLSVLMAGHVPDSGVKGLTLHVNVSIG